MPQSSLPDLNTIWLKWMDSINSCLRNNDYVNAIASVFHVNAVFAGENRIEFNTTKYEQLTNATLMKICYHCKSEIPSEDVRSWDRLLPPIERLLCGKKYRRCWDCPKCNKYVYLDKTDFVQESFTTPRYLGVVPEPPEIQHGIVGRKDFEMKARNWIRLALDEISYSLGAERRDYVPVSDRDDMIDDDDND